MSAGSPRNDRREPEDRSVRRTWWLLSATFLILSAITGIRALTSGDALAWAPLLAVALAAVAAIAHRNAVVALEVRGRAEAENFARILSGLSRSVSVDAIVGAIVDDLIEGTGADHVVVARRRPESGLLEATLVTRRAGVPNSDTVLSLGDLDLDAEEPSKPAIASPARPETELATTGTGAGFVRWLGELLEDFGLPKPGRTRGPVATPRAEVLGTGSAARAAARIAERVREVYGLSHTLAAPLRTDMGVVGAIVVSRRDREAWDVPARRLLEGAAVEAAAALARAYSHRLATANASTDPLTGLPNRRYFDEFCGLLAHRRRSGDAVAILMIDIDKFKVLNDTYGHPVGDEVLKAVAGAIISAVREEDVPARVGGEEFAVLLRNPGPDVAVEVGERVREAVRALDLSRHGVPGVSVSVGVANARDSEEAITSVVERADQALLRAKRAGRDRVIAT